MARKSNRGAQGAGTIRQRKDGRWEARYTVGRDPGTGKQVQRSVYGATQREVRTKLAQLTVEIDSGTYKEPCKMKLGEWLDIWTADYLNDVKPRTIESYTEQIKNHIKPALGAVKLETLTTPAIQRFYNQLGMERDGTISLCGMSGRQSGRCVPPSCPTLRKPAAPAVSSPIRSCPAPSSRNSSGSGPQYPIIPLPGTASNSPPDGSSSSADGRAAPSEGPGSIPSRLWCWSISAGPLAPRSRPSPRLYGTPSANVSEWSSVRRSISCSGGAEFA